MARINVDSKAFLDYERYVTNDVIRFYRSYESVGEIISEGLGNRLDLFEDEQGWLKAVPIRSSLGETDHFIRRDFGHIDVKLEKDKKLKDVVICTSIRLTLPQ